VEHPTAVLTSLKQGPGGDTSQRIPQEHLLSAQEARNFTVEAVFLEQPKWIDFDYLF
jgi:hypothetical protein